MIEKKIRRTFTIYPGELHALKAIAAVRRRSVSSVVGALAMEEYAATGVSITSLKLPFQADLPKKSRAK